MGTAIWFNGPSIISSGLGTDFMAAGSTAPREVRHPTQNLYRTKDGRFLITSMLGDFDDEWADFCEHLGRPDLITDPRFATSADRYRNCGAAVSIFDEIFAQHTLDDWKAKLATTKGVWSPIQTPLEMFDDPQTAANGFLRPVNDRDGEVRLPIPPILFDEKGGDPPVAPRFAQHTDDVLRELGFSWDQINDLRAAGTIA
jgi:crotonobetainyl-CoA:carnitine CoA-transferase CaiB-like acyl-CoA transferase